MTKISAFSAESIFITDRTQHKLKNLIFCIPFGYSKGGITTLSIPTNSVVKYPVTWDVTNHAIL